MKKRVVLLLSALLWANSAPALKLFGGIINIDDDLLEAPGATSGEGNKKPWERGGGNTNNRSGSIVNGSASFHSKRDVDIVAGRIKREFGFQTREEAKMTMAGEWGSLTSGFHDDVQPGVYYHMGGYIRHPRNNPDGLYSIQVLIERAGRGCQVDFTFNARADDENAYGRSLVAKAKRAIRR